MPKLDEIPSSMPASRDGSRSEPPTGSRMDGVPPELSALATTDAQCRHAALDGFDWPDASGVLRKVHEELRELQEAIAAGDRRALIHEYGDALMALASVGRHIGVAPDHALHTANARFDERFREMERIVREQGQRLGDLTSEQLEDLWTTSKHNTKSSTSG